jgi:hypothetical protein
MCLSLLQCAMNILQYVNQFKTQKAKCARSQVYRLAVSNVSSFFCRIARKILSPHMYKGLSIGTFWPSSTVQSCVHKDSVRSKFLDCGGRMKPSRQRPRRTAAEIKSTNTDVACRKRDSGFCTRGLPNWLRAISPHQESHFPFFCTQKPQRSRQANEEMTTLKLRFDPLRMEQRRL